MVSKSKNLGFFGDSRNVAVSNSQLRVFKRKGRMPTGGEAFVGGPGERKCRAETYPGRSRRLEN